MTDLCSSQFHLFVDPIRECVGATATSNGPHKLELSSAPTELRLTAAPALLALPGGDAPREDRLIVEPVVNRDRQPRVLLLAPRGREVTVNGEAAPCVALLKEGDQFQVDYAFNFHVALFQRPRIGTPPPELIGKTCPVCLVPFTAESRCFVCACGRAMHLEGGAGQEDKLRCAEVHAECPGCRRPIVLQEGYASLPAFAYEH